MEQIKDENIKIQAEVLDARRCRFKVDRPVFRAGGTLQFQNREEAKESPLAELIFGIEGVTGVLLAFDVVTVQKENEGDWRSVGKLVGKAIRAHLKSEEATYASTLSEMPENATAEDTIRAKVEHVLETQINPSVAGHGGRVSLLDIKGSVVYIKMGGGCQGCGMASVTLKQGIEKSIRHFVPEVSEILDVTDHHSGKNPYYAPSKK